MKIEADFEIVCVICGGLLSLNSYTVEDNNVVKLKVYPCDKCAGSLKNICKRVIEGSF